MPRHIHYVEPYFGGGAVLLARDPEDESLWMPPHKGVSEVVCDINGHLMNFWQVLASPAHFEAFRIRCAVTPLGNGFWEQARHILERDRREPLDRSSWDIELAWSFFVCVRQSLAGRGKSFTPLTRNRLRRQMNGNVSEWLGAVDGLADVHARLRLVAILEPQPALKVIRSQDAPGTLHYLDPPYLDETRASPDVYDFEMTSGDHRELLDCVRQVRGKVMLSGYRSAMYDTVLHDWNRHDKDVPNNAAGGETKQRKTECLWCNF